MPVTTKPVLFVDAPDREFIWKLKRAALDERTTLRGFVITILTDWLRGRGYLEPRGCGNPVSEVEA